MAQPSGTTGKGSGLAPNVASTLSYICMPITSIIFLLLEKENKDVQYHSWQGLLLGAGYIVTVIAIQIIATILSAVAGFLGAVIGLLGLLVGLVTLVLWIICLIKAYQGERWKIPYLGDIAETKAGLAS